MPRAGPGLGKTVCGPSRPCLSGPAVLGIRAAAASGPVCPGPGLDRHPRRPGAGRGVSAHCVGNASFKLGGTELTGTNNAPSFEPLATELREVQRGQGRSLMIVEGPNQVARLRRHLEALRPRRQRRLQKLCRRCSNGPTTGLRSWKARSPRASCCRRTASTSTAKKKFSASRVRAGASGRPPRARCSISKN